MGWYAVQSLQEALDETREFLWPFDVWRWLRLSVIVFFVGGSGGGFSGLNNAGQGFSQSFGDGTTGDGSVEALEQNVSEALSDPEVVGLIAIAAAVILFLFVLFSYLSAVFEFVFYRALIDDEVRIRAPFRRYAVDGLKYMLFRLAVLFVILGSIAGAVAAFLSSPGLGLIVVPTVIFVWLLISVIGFFVKTLAIPTMVRDDAGFVDALRITGRQVREEWRQAGVFFLANVVVTIAAGVIVALGFVVALIALAIPLVILGLLFMAVSDVLVAIPVLLGVIGLLVAWVLLAVPVQTYVYRWILDVHAGFADAG